MKTVRCPLALIGMLIAPVVAMAALPVADDFEGYPFGYSFLVASNGWQTSAAATVSGPPYQSPTQAVAVGMATDLGRQVAPGGATQIWTDLQVQPVFGAPWPRPQTNDASLYVLVNAAGFAQVATNGGWLVCSNDLQRAALTALASNTFVRLSFHQNFTTRRCAVFVNNRVVLQDLPFVGTQTQYNAVGLQNAASNAWLDDVAIQTTRPATLSGNYNGDSYPDAEELDTFGYIASTIHVGPTEAYTTLAAGLAAARPRDALSVAAGVYAGHATVSNSTVLSGGSFTNAGSVNVAAGATLTLSAGLTADALAVTGQVVVTGAGIAVTNLTVATGATLSFSNSALTVASVGVTLTGTFTIDDTWGTDATVWLPFADDFEGYGLSQRIDRLGFRGWGASKPGVIVQNTVAQAGKATLLPAQSVVSNRIASAASRVWTDCYVRPQLGVAPAAPGTSGASFLGYFDTNGYLVVYDQGGTVVCTNYWNGATVPAVTGADFVRLTIHHDYDNDRFAVFLDGKLLREQLVFPGGALSAYHGLAVENTYNSAYLDGVGIGAPLPAALTDDQDDDNIADAQEIHDYGELGVASAFQTLFLFK